MQTRRDFLKFIGATSFTITMVGPLASCSKEKKHYNIFENSPFPSSKDDLVLLPGLKYDLLISWGDQMSKQHTFGYNNDYINFHALSNDELIMWVNHEYPHPLFVSGWDRTKANIDIEKYNIGGSLIKVKKENGRWTFIPNDKHNKAIRGNTMIPFANNIKIKGSKAAEGTISNCAGGKTPWGTILTCEENYDQNYGDRNSKGQFTQSRMGWEKFYPKNIPEHYGWVVEVNPLTGEAKKHTNLGRFRHECATCVTAKKGNTVVYSGEDKVDEYIYKFISDSGDNFDKGVLYTADLKNGIWLPLDLNLSPQLKKTFSKQIDVLTYASEAAKILGATPCNRPEDFEVHPRTGDIYIALTNNKPRGDFHGSILKISETGADHNSLSFKSETFIIGGEMSELSCPDNLAFDHMSNLWITNDISGSAMGKKPYTNFKNNGLFVVPARGNHAGRVIQVASAPIDAELTGPCFSPDNKTLFLAVQHPGEMTRDIKVPTSTWPTGKVPKPSVVAIDISNLNF